MNYETVEADSDTDDDICMQCDYFHDAINVIGDCDGRHCDPYDTLTVARRVE